MFGSDVLLKSKAFLKAPSGKALDSAIAYCDTALMASFSRPLVKDCRISIFATFSPMYLANSVSSDSFLLDFIICLKINLSTASSVVSGSTWVTAFSEDDAISKDVGKARRCKEG